MGFTERPRRIVQTGPGMATRPANAATGRAVDAATGPDLYRRRSQELLDTVRRLDAGLDEDACRRLAEWVKEEYATAYGSVPLGFLAECRLGPPYVDHRLSLFHAIVEHFAPGDPVPPPFDKARMLVRSGGYAYVEVHDSGAVIPVLDDGTAVRP